MNCRFKLDVTIPPNTTATVFIPGRDAEKVLESGVNAQNVNGVTLLKQQEKSIIYEVTSGHYQFDSPWEQ